VGAVEFALILPLFLTILFATMDYGWMFFNQIVIASAAREGARVGALTAGTQAQVESAATVAAKDFMDQNGIKSSDASVTSSLATGSTPKTVTTAIALTFKPLVGVLFLPAGAQPYPSKLNAKAVMRYEN
jgi:Flp pilus assembly protein TadG